VELRYKNGLLWEREGDVCARVNDYRSPSWSWASTNDAIQLIGRPLKTSPLQLQIMDTRIALRNSSDPYGGIRSAYLVVEGRTRRLLRSKQVVKAGGFSYNHIGFATYDEFEDGQDRKNTSDYQSEIYFADENCKDLLSLEARSMVMEDWKD
jgi:hypothetical protein